MRQTRAMVRLAIVLAFAAVVACKGDGKRQTHSAIGADGTILRDAFNADVGTVRVILLVAPS